MKLSETIEINDKVLVRLANVTEDKLAVVTGVDDDMELIFINIKGEEEDYAVDGKQIISNLGQDKIVNKGENK